MRTAGYLAPIFILAVIAIVLQYRWVQQNRYKFSSPTGVEIIRCPYCGGSGTIKLPSGELAPCPVCYGAGSRIIRRFYPEDRLCPACEGMGRLPARDGSAITCPRCGGRGLIRTSVTNRPAAG